ncbi:MAG: hypothetical protein E7A38_19020, partial [Leclercia adecarboxylata]|nr:hypothetical protein [Leclercia adecarboxylata]
MDRIITSSRDRTSLLSTHKVLRNTYFMLSLTLAFSAITATASTVLMLPSPGLILTLVGMYGLMFLTYKTADKPVGILSAFAFTGFLLPSDALRCPGYAAVQQSVPAVLCIRRAVFRAQGRSV